MKKKTFIVQLLDSKKPSRTSFTQIEDALFYSNDTDASLVFIPHEDTFDFETAKVVMFNRGDESLVERDAVVSTEDGRKAASYELPDEIISHWGDWIAQPVFISGGEIYSGAIVPFSVERHLMHERPPKLTEIVTVTEFIEQSQSLVNAMIQAEAQRITEEQTRQSAEENRVQAESERSGKYESYAQQFNDVITDLSEEKDYHSLPEISAARGGEKTLGERLDKEHNEVTAQLAHTTKDMTNQLSKEIINPLYIQTWDGSNEPYHPSVLYFPKGWNGAQYWMAYTPFPVESQGYRDRWECPSIAISNDGINWTLPRNFNNPLADLTQSQIERGDYFSDPSLVMVGNTMEVYFRRSNGSDLSDTNVYRMTTTNGSDWTELELVFDSQSHIDISAGTPALRSLQVIYKDGKYITFYCTANEMRRAETTDPSSALWTNVQTLNIIGGSNNPWHMALYYEEETGIFHMIYFKLDETVHYLTSSDGLNFEHKKELISVSDRKYSNLTALYQSYPVKTDYGWDLFLGGTFKSGANTRMRKYVNGLFLMRGESLMSLSISEEPRTNYNRIYLEGDLFLNNKSLPNSKDRRLVFHLNDDESEMYYMNVVEENGFYIPKYNTPGSVANNFVSTRINPNLTPAKYAGEIFIRSVNPPEIFISDQNRNWRRLAIFEEFNLMKSRKDIGLQANLDVSGVSRIVLGSVITDEPISNISGGVDGQEIVIINVTGRPITFKHSQGSKDRLRLKTNSDTVVGKDSTICFLCVGDRSDWWEI